MSLAWACSLGLCVVFGWELSAGCGTDCIIEALVWAGPMVAVLLFGGAIGITARDVGRVLIIMLAWLLFSVTLRGRVEAYCMLLRRGEELHAQRVRALRGDTVSIHWRPGASFRLRVDRGMVFWPLAEWGLGSAGLVHASSMALREGENGFRETVRYVEHLYGDWYFCSLT